MNNHDYIDDIEGPIMRWCLTEIKKSDDKHDALINNMKNIQKKLNDRKKQEINKIKRIKQNERGVKILSKKGYDIKQVRIPK